MSETNKLFCFTTQVDEQKSIGEIISMLVQGRARQIRQDFDGAGNVTAISFSMLTKHGEMGCRLPIDVPATHQVLKDQHKARKIERRYADDSAHARRVAWRILRYWVEVQLALISLGNARVEQLFLAFIQANDGSTLFEQLEKRQFQGLTLTEKAVA